MFRILMSVAVALCVVGNLGRAQAADENPREAPKRPAARQPAQADAPSAASPRRETRPARDGRRSKLFRIGDQQL